MFYIHQKYKMSKVDSDVANLDTGLQQSLYFGILKTTQVITSNLNFVGGTVAIGTFDVSYFNADKNIFAPGYVYGQGPAAVAMGSNAGANNQGAQSVAIGTFAGFQAQKVDSVAIGNSAGFGGQGTRSVAIGVNAGSFNQASESVAIGVDAGYCNQGAKSVSIGNRSGMTNQGSQSVAIGNNSGSEYQGSNSVAIGEYSGQFSQGYNSVAIGDETGRYFQGVESVAIGNQSGFSNQGNRSVAIGILSAQFNQGSDSVAIGSNCAANNQGSNSVAIGSRAGIDYQGSNCVAISSNAASSFQKPNAVAIGIFAGQYNQGTNAIAIGFAAGRTNQPANSIVLNSDEHPFTPGTSGFFVKFVGSNSSGTGNVLQYEVANSEIFANRFKSFVIDHPQHDDKYLVHSCLEGPENGVFYRGVEYIKNSFIEIKLPEYTSVFSEFDVHVTPVLDDCNTIESELDKKVVSTNVVNGCFKIFSNKPTRVSYVVIGKRGELETEPYKKDKKVMTDGPYTYFMN